MRRLRFAAPLLALAVLPAGCSLATDVEPEIAFASQRADWTSTLVAHADVAGSSRAIFATGLILTPNDCYNLRATLDAGRDMITVTVSGRQATSQCASGAPGAYNYQFTAAGLDNGDFTIRIVHAYEGGVQPSEVILEKQVTIT